MGSLTSIYSTPASSLASQFLVITFLTLVLMCQLCIMSIIYVCIFGNQSPDVLFYKLAKKGWSFKNIFTLCEYIGAVNVFCSHLSLALLTFSISTLLVPTPPNFMTFFLIAHWVQFVLPMGGVHQLSMVCLSGTVLLKQTNNPQTPFTSSHRLSLALPVGEGKGIMSLLLLHAGKLTAFVLCRQPQLPWVHEDTSPLMSRDTICPAPPCFWFLRSFCSLFDDVLWALWRGIMSRADFCPRLHTWTSCEFLC